MGKKETIRTLDTNSGHRERLRERFSKVGLRGFADYEIVEMLLTLCIPRKDVKPIAKYMVDKFGSVKNILDADISLLNEVKNIGKVSPVAIKFIKELISFYNEETCHKTLSLETMSDVKNFWRSRMHGLKNEVFEVALLDDDLSLLNDGIHRLEEGTTISVKVHPRKIVELAMKHGASNIIIAHNHIIGTAEPSNQDEILTRIVKTTLHCLEISIFDHIIVGKHDIFSFREKLLI